MKAAQQIAQRLFDAKVRLNEGETGALLIMPQHLRLERFVVSTWHAELHFNIEVQVSAQQVRTLGIEQAWFDAAFSDMQGSDISMDIDEALWEIQQEDIRERRAQECAFFREQVS